MKKFLLIFCFLLGLIGLIGCKKEEQVNLTLWHYYNNDQAIYFDNLIDDFNQTIGKEKKIFIDSQSKGYNKDLITALYASANKKPGAEEMPNLFMAYADTALTIDSIQEVVSLDPYFTEDEIKEYFSTFIEEGRLNQSKNLKIFPIAKSTEVLMVNLTDWNKFVSANPDRDLSLDHLKTIEGVIETAEIYYNWSGKAFYGRDSLSNYFTIGAKSLGLEILDGSNNVNLNEAIFKKLWESYYIPYIKGYFSSSGAFRSVDISTNNIICFTGSSSGAKFFPKGVNLTDEVYYEVEPYVGLAPVFKNTEPIFVQQGAGMVVSKKTMEEEKASVEFLKWFTSENINTDFSVNTSYMPVKKSSVNNLDIEQTNASSVEKQSLRIVKDLFMGEKLYTSRPTKNGSDVRDILDQHLENKAKNDRAKIMEELKKGILLGDAIASYISHEAFIGWYNEISELLLQNRDLGDLNV